MGEDARTSGIEKFKALSTFVSSVVLAAAGLLVTNCYNGKQVEISRNKELSAHLSKLGSTVEAERRAAALALSLYGEQVIPPLIAVLGDTAAQVRDAAVTALAAIGKPAEDEVARVFARSLGQSKIRAASLRAWGLIGDDSVYEVAKGVLLDSREMQAERLAAADVMLRFKNDSTASHFMSALRFVKDEDPDIAPTLMYYLPFLANAHITPDLTELVSHRDSAVREFAIWSIALLSQRDSAAIAAYRELLPTFRCDPARNVEAAVVNASSRLGLEVKTEDCPGEPTVRGPAAAPPGTQSDPVPSTR